MHQYAKTIQEYPKIGFSFIYRASSCSHIELNINKFRSQIFYTETIFKYSIISKKIKNW
jgi:hypothetical protein